MNIIIYLYLNIWVIIIIIVFELGQIFVSISVCCESTPIHTRLCHSDSSVIRFLPHTSVQNAVSN